MWCQFGVEFVAEHLLPMLCPLLIAQQLNVQQFAKYMHFVKEILRFALTLVSIGENHVVLKVHVWSRIRHVGTRR